MRSILKPVLIAAFTGSVLVACDRGPTGLSPSDVDALLSASGIAAADSKTSGTVLPILLRESIVAVEKVEGRAGVESLLGDWRKLQEDLKSEAATGDRSTIEARLAQIHAEELRIVRSVLGNNGILRLVNNTNAGMAAVGLSVDAARAAGRDVSRALALSEQVRLKLAATNRALVAKSATQALDHAAEAAGTLVTLKHHLLELQRVEGIETLYPRAIDKVREARGPSVVATLTTNIDIFNKRSRAALRSGDKAAAQENLTLMRAEQIRIVRQVFGDEAAVKLVAQVGIRADEVAANLKVLDSEGRDVAKQQRMLREALNLRQRATDALAAGDAATALDLGSHAAGLLNTLQHLTWY